ncbi:energy-coupling factor ABC transporter permease [Paludibacterium sp. B53371]|uniref:energy-coupling factor ABC transporter permease n=1 Tax=Paludibacterium sp. B53371 TaxID=2806263 RepID=UPI001C05BF2D|nr:energy-coupling factor ABC transporter permease [Paludibacterium sp. B53371]
MSFPAGLFPLPWLLGLNLLALLVLAGRVRRVAWRRIPAAQANAWLGACVLVMVMWTLRDDYLPGLSYHLLGMTLLGLMMGPSLALLASALVIVVAVLATGGDWASLGLVWLCCGVLPIGASWLGLRLTQRLLPANYFVYLFLNAFLAGGVGMALAGLASVLVLGAAAAYPWGMLFDEALPYYLLLAWSEAFTTGLMMAILIVYRPQWVLTFEDARYLNDRYSGP